jgi:TetR/AcrR family transcriptional repressor of mexCD-oprJ operon
MTDAPAQPDAPVDPVAARILDAASALLSADGDLPSMAQIAACAGVGRATLYRHVPSRESLLRQLAARAIAEIGRRLHEAELGTVPPPEGLARLARLMLDARLEFLALKRLVAAAGESVAQEARARDAIGRQVLTVFGGGLRDGLLRSELDAEQHRELFFALLTGIAPWVDDGRMPVERASALVVSLYLTGARAGA